jgi:ABC-2 type transport system permease protein
MRSYSEELKEGTLELIATQPLSKLELIIAKFLSSFIFVLILLALTIPIPITINILGNPDNGVIIAGYIGLILLASSYIAIGQFISINTQNQIVAFIVSVVLIGILYLFGESQFLIYLPTFTRPFFESLGLGSHFRSIARGVIDSRDLLYYISIIIVMILFIYKSFQRIQKQGK